MSGFPVGLEIDVSYPDFAVSLTLRSDTQLQFAIKEGPFARTEVSRSGREGPPCTSAVTPLLPRPACSAGW